MIRLNPTAIPLRSSDLKALQAELDRRKAEREKQLQRDPTLSPAQPTHHRSLSNSHSASRSQHAHGRRDRSRDARDARGPADTSNVSERRHRRPADERDRSERERDREQAPPDGAEERRRRRAAMTAQQRIGMICK